MTRTDRPGPHGRTVGSDPNGSRPTAGDEPGTPTVATVAPALAGGRSPILAPVGVVGVVVAVVAVVGTAFVGTAVGRVRGRRRSVEGCLDAGGDADPAVLSLVADPYETVEGTHRRLRALERLFREREDRRAVFLTVYARVTGEVAASIDRGAFEDPAWVADYLVRFADRYRQAVYGFEIGRVDELPTAWRLAFLAAEREETLVLQHAALGINAHVAFDLAFALLAVGVCDDRRAKYRDHRRINRVLWRLVDPILDRLAERYATGIDALVDAVGPLVEVCWFAALVIGRECAWWVALVLAGSGRGYSAPLARWLVAAASAAVARAVLGPTAHPASVRVLRSVARRFGVRRL